MFYLQMTGDIETAGEDGRLSLDMKKVRDAIEWHDAQIPRLQNLWRYYNGQHDILDAEAPDDTSPDNRVASGYPRYIVDMIQGYTFGKPVTYKFDSESMEDDISEIFSDNDEIDENSDIANYTGIFGTAFELLYQDEEANPRFNQIKPTEGFIVYDDKITPDPLFGIRRYQMTLDENIVEFVEVRTKQYVYHFEKRAAAMTLMETEEHYFGDVPMVEFPNNSTRTGDFEHVLTQIDAYDKALSEKLNDLEYFTNAYMYLVGFDGSKDEDIDRLKRNRVILLEDAGDAGFLTKNSNEEESKGTRNDLNSDIHKFAFVPDLSDENFANNASGVAMAYKLFGTEQLAVNKERKFTTGLMRRIELLCNYIQVKKNTFHDYRGVEMHFTRNVPVDEKAAVEMFVALEGRVSMETALSVLPFISNIAAEMKRIQEERDAYAGDMT